jgi:hypothetical protein
LRLHPSVSAECSNALAMPGISSRIGLLLSIILR